MQKKIFLIILTSFPTLAFSNDIQQRILSHAKNFLENGDISYLYGGSETGNQDICHRCNKCLESHAPAKKNLIKTCPACNKCGIDCSHFTQLIYNLSGLPMPYITTKGMRDLHPFKLEKYYHIFSLGTDLRKAKPGDLLLYNGHVVILEKLQSRNFGDIIHATSGRNLKGPGQGIQRQRKANLSRFHGPLLKILRHQGALHPKGIKRLRPPKIRKIRHSASDH